MTGRPGRILTLVIIVTAIGLVVGTGAYTTVAAERTVTVTVAGDKAALLGLKPYPGPNGAGTAGSGGGFARLQSGTLTINIGGAGTAATGVNMDAKTDLHNVFLITNRGAQPIAVSITDQDGSDDDRLVTFYNESIADYEPGTTQENGLEGTTHPTLTPGETLVVSIYIDTTGQTLADISDDDGDGIKELVTEITVRAQATE